jgi:hypothetical protein
MDRAIRIKPEFADLAAKAIDARGAALNPPEGAGADSLLGRDRSAVYALDGEIGEVRQRLLLTGIGGAVIALALMEDGMAALRHDVTRDPPPIWSPVTLARTVARGVRDELAGRPCA